MKKAILLAALAALISGYRMSACTNLLVGKAASTDGSTFITYSMDMYGYCAKLRIVPATDHRSGEKAKVINYETDELLGEIPQVSHTHGVIGYINDCQLSITETTFGGREGQANPKGLLDYSSLIQLTLERAGSAREAIGVIDGLVSKYGYCSTGESLSIADPDEVWIMEIIGKGSDAKGAVWAAVRIPDDCISAHANQSRIHRFDLYGEENVLHSKDVISYARKKGFFSGKDEEFDFSAAYSPTDFGKQRICEARVWSIFNRFSEDAGRYFSSVDGFHIGESEEMPLYIRPDRKLSLQDAIEVMRDHYEGTPLDATADIAGGPWNSPYQPAPLTWSSDGMTYFNERPIATQQSACVEIYQMRSSLPDHIGGVLWFANDDGAMVSYTPLYCGATRLPLCYSDPEASDVNFSWNSAFWVCNWVSNMVYPHYSLIYPELCEVRDRLQDKFIREQAAVENRALALNAQEAAELLTGHGERCAAEMMDEWKDMGMRFIVKYNDLAVKPEKDGEFVTTGTGHATGLKRPGYSSQYRRAIAEQTGSRHYKGEMTFVQISDTQIGFVDTTAHFRMSDSLMTAAVRAINKVKPACVILTGDLVNDFGNAEQLELYTKRMGGIEESIPVYVVPGNHDIRKFKPENHQRYMDFVGYDRFSFKKGDCAFIGFDSCRIKADSDYASMAEEEQFNWLEAELAKAVDCRHIFLFCHCPVAMESLDEKDGHNSFPLAKRDRYVQLFKKYGVEAVFSGHSHVCGYFEDNGIRYINSIPVATGFGRGFPGINVVKVGRDGFDYEFRKSVN